MIGTSYRGAATLMSSAFFQKTAIGICLGIVLAFYLWTASSSGNPFRFEKTSTAYYNLLSDAFLSGRTSLLIEPKKELLELSDPYDPKLNYPYRLHDASLYKGKYYLYFGPTPALALFIPFRLIAGYHLPENFAVAMFCFGGLVWSILTLNFLRRMYASNTPFWMRFLAITCLSLSTAAPYLLRRPLFYEVAISSAYFFFSGALYFLVSARLDATPRLWRCALGSLFLGLATGSRPHFVFTAVLPLLLWIKSVRNHNESGRRDHLRSFVCLFMPFMLCIALLGLYNYARFGSFTEFGVTYVLMGAHPSARKVFEFAKLLPGLYFFFLCPSRINLDFPFFHLDIYNSPYSLGLGLPIKFWLPAQVAGVLLNIPFIIIVFLLTPFYLRNLRSGQPHVGLMVASFVLLAFTLALSISGGTGGFSMRYVIEFVPLLLLAALLLWFLLHKQLDGQPRRRRLLHSFCIVAIIYGSLFNLAISLTGVHDQMRVKNPQAYHAIEKVFAPLQKSLAPLAGYSAANFGPLALRIQFPHHLPRMTEPLVVTGRTGAGDFTLVKYLGADTVAFGFNHWGRGDSLGAPIKISPGGVYDLEVHMGSLYPQSASMVNIVFPGANYDEIKDLLLMKLNGREVLRDQFQFHPSSPSQVTIGENRIGRGVTTRSFSGIILSLKRIAPPSTPQPMRTSRATWVSQQNWGYGSTRGSGSNTLNATGDEYG